MKIKITPCKGGLESKIKRLIKSQDSAEVGWFDQQGVHTQSGKTFPDLARYHATGSEGVTPRRMLKVASIYYEGKNKPEVTKAISTYLETPSQGNLNDIMDMVGKTYWDTLKWVLGNPTMLPVTNNPTPLVDTGELRDNTARRTTKRPSLKTK